MVPVRVGGHHGAGVPSQAWYLEFTWQGESRAEHVTDGKSSSILAPDVDISSRPFWKLQEHTAR